MSISLFEACQHGKSELVKYFIDQQCDINHLDEQGRSALHYCCENTNAECAKLLLVNETTKTNILNLKDHEGCTALHLACMIGNEIMVKFLCEQGADVTTVDNELHSLIHWITVCGHLHLFDILVEYKAPVHTADIHSAYPIHYASQLSACSENVEEQIDSTKGLAILQKFIDQKVDIDCVDGQNRTPFIWAASIGAIDAVRLLYKYGANQLHADKDCLTALHCAATRGYTSCIQMLVEQCGCTIEGEDINGCTALFYAITFKYPQACQLLLELKANPNHKDHRGRTPSHCALSKGDLDCLKSLIKWKGNLWIKSKRGDYPVHEAINTLANKKLTDDYTSILAAIRYVFELYPKRINIPNDEHRTALHLAANFGDIEICTTLIQCGARINAFMRTSSGNYITPYDLARIRGHKACAEYLLWNHGGQRGNLLANIFSRRIQRYYRQYQIRKKTAKKNHSRPIAYSNKSHSLLAQAQICLDNKRIDDCEKMKSLSIQLSTSGDENKAQERRRAFAKSKTAITSINHSGESRPDSSNKIIIYTSNSIATSKRLYDRRKLIVEELHKLRQARIHNHLIVINRPLYKILIENAFNPQNRDVDEIEQYLQTLIKAYDAELAAIRERTRSVPPKPLRRRSQLF